MTEKELIRQHVRHMVEQGGMIDPTTDRHIDKYIYAKRAALRGLLWVSIATATFVTAQLCFD